jgi:hypothetical protein
MGFLSRTWDFFQEGAAMPHDRYGATLKPGDKVSFEAEVVALNEQEDACNGNFRICDVTGCREYVPEFTCNTKHAALIGNEPEVQAPTPQTEAPTEASAAEDSA